MVTSTSSPVSTISWHGPLSTSTGGSGLGLALAVLVDEVRGRGVVGQPDGHGQPREARVHVGDQWDGGPLDVLEDHARELLLPPVQLRQDPRVTSKIGSTSRVTRMTSSG